MGDLLLKIFNMSFNASIMVLAVLIIRLFTKKAPKLVNILLWSAVALRLCLPFSFESMLSLLPSKEVLTTAPPSVSASTPAPSQNVPQVDIGVPVINDTVNEYINESTVSSPKAEESFIDVMFILSIVWACGVAIMLFYALISYIRLKRTVRISVQKENNVFYCDNIRSPFVLGFVRPKIYLPSGIESTDERYVLMHENAHIKRKDFLWKPLGFLLLSVHWFNPVIWLAYTVFCRDIELACDEKAINNMSKTEIIEYSKSLLNCTANPKLMMVNPLAFGEVSVKNRIKNILNYKKPPLWIIITAVILSVCLAVGFLTDPLDKGKTEKKKDTDNITETVTYEIIEEPSSEPTEPLNEENKPVESKPQPTIPTSTPKKSDKYINANDKIGDLSLETVKKIKELYFQRIKSEYRDITIERIYIAVNFGTMSDGSVIVKLDLSGMSYPAVLTVQPAMIVLDDYLYHAGLAPNVFKNNKLESLGDAYNNGTISKKVLDEFFTIYHTYDLSKKYFHKKDNCDEIDKLDICRIKQSYNVYAKTELSKIIIEDYYGNLKDNIEIVVMRIDNSTSKLVTEEIGDFEYTHPENQGLYVYYNHDRAFSYGSSVTDLKNAYSDNKITDAELAEIFSAYPQFVSIE